MVKKSFVIASFLSCLLNCQVFAVLTFKTENMKKAARIVGILDSLECIAPGQTQTIKAKDGQIIEVRKSMHNVIDHIGIPLFNDQMRTLMPSPVYDFLEFAVLNIKYKVNPNTLYLSKVMFKKGSWNTLIHSQLIQSDFILELLIFSSVLCFPGLLGVADFASVNHRGLNILELVHNLCAVPYTPQGPK